MMEVFSRYDMKNTSVLYVEQDELVGLVLVPTHMIDQIVWERNIRIEPLVQFRLAGDDFNNGFTNGLTLRSGKSTRALRITAQHRDEDCVTTTLADDQGRTFHHFLHMDMETDTVRLNSEVVNTTDSPVCVEMLSSFTLGNLSPFDKEESTDLFIHRFQSFWSAEGRHQRQSLYDLHLERAWIAGFARCERYGSIGSMPVRGYFPFGAVEDSRSGVIWAAQLAHPASWQMELSVQDDALSFSGGLADYDHGHWRKQLLPGESFRTPEAILAVAQDSLDAVCHKLTAVQRKSFLKNAPTHEHDMPVAFNEYCTTWGNPTLENITRIADCMEGTGVKYLVIDCGWYSHQRWQACMGDWEPDKTLFPNGLKEAADYIRSKGMIPGLWFEMESVGVYAKAFHNEEHLLHRHGTPITVGTRRFWDMRDPWVQEYLAQKVIGLLRDCSFGYLKVDYNDNIGIGCDGCESLGEGLRQSLMGTQAFFRRIRKELPDLVIENCASGGHRLEPSMMALVSQASFSDAHETVSIPIIAANLHRLIHPAQSQIWAVLRKEDDEERLYYSMVNTFLGRMCISGDVPDLAPWQVDIMQRGIDFYHRVSDIILDGKSCRFGPEMGSYNHPTGWQGMLYVKGDKALYVLHTFGNEESVPLPNGWKFVESYGSPCIQPSCEDSSTLMTNPQKMCAKVFLMAIE